MDAVLHDESKDDQTAFPPASHQSVPTSPLQTKWEKVGENWPCATEKRATREGDRLKCPFVVFHSIDLQSFGKGRIVLLHTPANIVGAQSNIGPSPVSYTRGTPIFFRSEN